MEELNWKLTPLNSLSELSSRTDEELMGDLARGVLIGVRLELSSKSQKLTVEYLWAVKFMRNLEKALTQVSEGQQFSFSFVNDPRKFIATPEGQGVRIKIVAYEKMQFDALITIADFGKFVSSIREHIQCIINELHLPNSS